MSSLDDAMSKLSNLGGSEGAVYGRSRELFMQATSKLYVKVVDNVDVLKTEKNDLVRATVMNTIGQYANFIDFKGVKPNKIDKSIGQLGITVMYAVQRVPVGIHIHISQDGKDIAYKLITFQASKSDLKCNGEDVRYDASNIGKRINTPSAKDLESRIVADEDAMEKASRVAHSVAISTVATGIAVSSIDMRTGGVLSNGVSRAKDLAVASREMLVEDAATLTKGVGSVVGKGTTSVVNAGTRVASKVGVKGAQEFGKNIGSALAKESVQTGIGAGVVVAGVLVGSYCAYKALSNSFVPTVYHYVEEAQDDTSRTDVFVSFTLMPYERGIKQLGVNKEGKSVLVVARDYTDEKVLPTEAFPIVSNDRRKSLYGMFATTSTFWPATKERTEKLMQKLSSLKRTTV